MSPELGRFLVVIGIVLVVLGALAMAGIRLPFGRLPGDIAITGDRGGLYIPLGTMLVVSIVLTLLFNLFLRR
jgi:membrane protein implicated in regulation of membrane protease activity